MIGWPLLSRIISAGNVAQRRWPSSLRNTGTSEMTRPPPPIGTSIVARPINAPAPEIGCQFNSLKDMQCAPHPPVVSRPMARHMIRY
jgi:hypothetical protein